MKDYLALWGDAQPNRNSRILGNPVTVIGERINGPKSEFARVQLTAYPADSFDVADHTIEKSELEKLCVEWPEPFIFGLLDALMKVEPAPLKNIRVVLEQVWYHDIDSSRNAFRMAGRDAGRRIIETIDSKRAAF